MSDTGIGIPEQYRETVFEEFSQIEHSLQKQVKGTGLGLSLSRKLAQLLGGEIGLEAPGETGSSFFLRVPSHYPEARKSEPDPDLPARGPLETALLVGEDDVACAGLRQALASVRCAVYSASGCRDALRLAREQSPSLIFLDLAASDKDGLKREDFLKELKGLGDMPVVIRTDRPLSAREEKKLKTLAFDILAKDMAYEPLLAYIERVGALLPERHLA